MGDFDYRTTCEQVKRDTQQHEKMRAPWRAPASIKSNVESFKLLPHTRSDTAQVIKVITPPSHKPHK